MKTFIGVFRCEYRMSIRRLSLWLAFGILFLPYMTSVLMPPDLAGAIPEESEVLSFAGTTGFMLNLFFPVVGGILAADRLVRDQKLGVDELLRSTPLNRWSYLLGKYFGTLFSVTTPVLLCSLILGAWTTMHGAPPTLIPAMLLSFLVINLPAYVFITAFSLVCPLVIPVRVYQVLFTGYWFWGNFLSPQVILTLNGTYITPNGFFSLYGLFGGFFGGGGPNWTGAPTSLDALINLSVLAAAAAAMLFVSSRYLALRASRA